MPAYMNDAVFDVALNYIKNNSATLHICTGTPSDRATAISQSLANVAMVAADITLGDATPEGRGVTAAAKNGVTVTGTGEPVHYCLISGTLLLARAEVDSSSPDLTAGSTVNIPAVTFEIGDAVTEV